MNQDQQTYKRAATAAAVGFVVQLVLAIVVALLGVYAESSALDSAAWYFFGGLPIWAVLWVLFNQHRLERAEALEAEQLARADARTAALFEEAGQQLQLHRQRLEKLYKWALPAVGLVLGLYLLVLGGLRFYGQYALLSDLGGGSMARGFTAAPEQIARFIAGDVSATPIVMVMVAVALMSFLVARYVAGMTQVRDWQLLRGGAGYLMGNALIATLLVVGGLMFWFERPLGLLVLGMLIPGVMALLGLEMLLGLVFSVYRPRKPGEVQRPSFESRILGWLTRPESLGKIVSETINYQFGFEISSSWFYRLIARALVPLIVIGAVVLVTLSSLVVVEADQNAVVTTFGRLESRLLEPGAHLKWPWPISKVHKEDVYRVKEISVGSLSEAKAETAVLWTNDHAEGQEEYLLIAPTPMVDRDQYEDVVAGELIGAEVVVKYRVAEGELLDYLTVADSPARVLENLAARRASLYFAMHHVEQLLTSDRLEAGRLLRQQIQADADAAGLGLDVVFVGVVGVHPPQTANVAQAFHEQIGALQEKQSTIEEANKYRIAQLSEVAGSSEQAQALVSGISVLERLRDRRDEVEGGSDAAEQLAQQITEQEVAVRKLLDSVGGEAAQVIHEARAYRWTQAFSEWGRAERFAAQLPAYALAPGYYRTRQYLDALAEGLAEQRKVIVTAEQEEPPTIRLELEDAATNLDALLGE
ncbi:MAG: SPFH domain-containing protein [Phycisphaeraceae bacterium]